jgi:hypothetical protein
VKPEAQETVPCAGFEGRIIGKAGATINRLQEETGCKINIEKGTGQGLALAPVSAQPQPFLDTDATAAVHFSAQPQMCFVEHQMAHEKCSRQAGNWRL